jgi:hypothetical protein
MPEPWLLHRFEADGQVLIFRGPHLFASFDADDLGMRNLAIVGLRNAGFSCTGVAACFGLTAQYVSTLRGRARDHGSEGIVRPRGRRRSLSAAQLSRAAAWSASGMSDVAIGKRLGVHSGTIGRRLAAVGERNRSAARVTSETLFNDNEPDQQPSSDKPEDGEHDEHDASDGDTQPADHVVGVTPSPLTRPGETEVSSRYAGAMLLHAFLTRLGAEEILSSLPVRAARRYDATALVLASTFSFALGTSSVEGTKHLVANDAGVLCGTTTFPHLRTLRPGLRALAEVTDPVALQTAFSKAMLAADEHPPEVFYADDHFVTYWGKEAVAKGYNIRRHLAEPGRDDTFVVDDTWRAVCFASGEPRGLSVTLPEVLGQLKEIVGDRRIMVGFDRGGSYPKVFTALAEQHMEWITWRRAPLPAPTATPKRSWVVIDGVRSIMVLADELVTLNGYDATPVRQLSAYEDGNVVFQVLTSNTELTGARLVRRLRGRWCIENTNKYLEDHQGIHWLATYEMDTEVHTAKVGNPARRAARVAVRTAETALTEAERALGREAESHHGDLDAHLAQIRLLRDDVVIARDRLDEQRAELKGVPAKLPANKIDPNAKRSRPRLAARALQMVCRLLAYNAELDLARALNTYLGDNDEYRAITRNLLHLGGMVAFERTQITVTLDRPGAPRIASALSRLLDQLNSGPPVHLVGDRRPIVYRLAA